VSQQLSKILDKFFNFSDVPHLQSKATDFRMLERTRKRPAQYLVNGNSKSVVKLTGSQQQRPHVFEGAPVPCEEGCQTGRRHPFVLYPSELGTD